MPKISKAERQNRVIEKALKAIESRPKDRAAILHELYECAWRDAETYYGIEAEREEVLSGFFDDEKGKK